MELTFEQKDKAQAWVDGLRSGDYNQITTFLHTDHGHCALGVGLDANGVVWTESERHGAGIYSPGATAMTSWIGEEQRELLGIPHTFEGQVFVERVVAKNDQGHPFTEVADYISKECGL